MKLICNDHGGWLLSMVVEGSNFHFNISARIDQLPVE